MIINVDEFLGRYDSLSVGISDELQHKLQASGAFADITDEEHRDLDFTEISYLRRAGQQAEEAGDMDGALTLYLESIRLGESSYFDMLHAYQYSYDLALAIVRNEGAVDREISLLTALLRHSNIINRRQYIDRLNQLSA